MDRNNPNSFCRTFGRTSPEVYKHSNSCSVVAKRLLQLALLSKTSQNGNVVASVAARRSDKRPRWPAAPTSPSSPLGARSGPDSRTARRWKKSHDLLPHGTQHRRPNSPVLRRSSQDRRFASLFLHCSKVHKAFSCSLRPDFGTAWRSAFGRASPGHQQLGRMLALGRRRVIERCDFSLRSDVVTFRRTVLCFIC
jgi:hypothetical protein